MNMSCAEPKPPIRERNKLKYGMDMATPTDTNTTTERSRIESSRNLVRGREEPQQPGLAWHSNISTAHAREPQPSIDTSIFKLLRQRRTKFAKNKEIKTKLMQLSHIDRSSAQREKMGRTFDSNETASSGSGSCAGRKKSSRIWKTGTI